MIFVCVGSREYQFDRLLKKLDEIVENGDLRDEIYAQIGQSNYIPKHYKYTRFLSSSEFHNFQKEADLIISHGGTGALISSLKLGKNVISVPRLSKYGEHTDDHQIQVSTALQNEGYLRMVLDIDELPMVILTTMNNPITKKYNKESRVLEIINQYIDNIRSRND